MATSVAAKATTFFWNSYVPVLTLPTQDNSKLLQQLKSDFKSRNNWNKYKTKVSTEKINLYFDFLIYSRFQGVNTLFVLSLEDEAHWKSYIRYYLPT